jgi:DNA modification methylase
VSEPYYQEDGITIYHGDCREILPALPRADLLLTDPPYGIGIQGRNGISKQAQTVDYGEVTWDDAPIDPALLQLAIRSAFHAVVFGGNYYAVPPSSCWLVWDKDNGANPFADCELAWTNLPKAVRRLRYRWQGMIQEVMGHAKEKRQHPTQKPVPVMEWCIGQAPDSCQTILDPFMGSGTTLVAAKNLGRHGIGIEIEERYCEIAAKRLAQGVLDFV